MEAEEFDRGEDGSNILDLDAVQRPPVKHPPWWYWGGVIFVGALALFGFLLSPLAIFFFDAPGSESNPLAIWGALTILSFGPLCVVAILGSVFSREKGYPRLSWYFLMLPLLSILSFGAFVGVVWV